MTMLLSSFAVEAKDVLPRGVFGGTVNSYGVYQVSENSIVLYNEPDDNAKVVKKITWNSESTDIEGLGLQDLFVVFLPDKELAMLTVVDETDDWVKVIYDDRTNESAWLKKDDPFKFLPWVTFYNIYGKKYGLYQLKQAPANSGIIRTSGVDDAQEVGSLNMPKTIKLNTIKGNWALVSVSDLDKYPKTGFVRWRGDNGAKYYFPLIKKIVGVNH